MIKGRMQQVFRDRKKWMRNGLFITACLLSMNFCLDVIGEQATFDAEIIDISTSQYGTVFHVNGFDTNDINHLGEFLCDVDDTTTLLKEGENIKVDDFEIGDFVSIIYSGNVQEIYPPIIEEVNNITFLEEEYMAEYIDDIEFRVWPPTFSYEYVLNENHDIVKQESMKIKISVRNSSEVIFENFNLHISFNDEAEEFILGQIKYYDSKETIGEIDLCPVKTEILVDNMRNASGIELSYCVDFCSGTIEKFNEIMNEMNVVLEWNGEKKEYVIPMKKLPISWQENIGEEFEEDKQNDEKMKYIVIKEFNKELLICNVLNIDELYYIPKVVNCEVGDVLRVYATGQVLQSYPGQMSIYGYDILHGNRASADVIDYAMQIYLS